MRLQQITTLIVAAIVVAATGTITGVASQETTTQPTEITSCQIIDEPGRYVLASDIENSTSNVCIDIQASDVHFDGGGHTVDGTVNRTQFLQIVQANPDRPRRTKIGININGTDSLSNVTITNVATSDWLGGVFGEHVSDVRVTEATSRSSGVGVWIADATDSRTTDSNTSNNYLGGAIFTSGFAPDGQSRNNHIVNITANKNGLVGINFLWSSNAVARNITAIGNGFHGVEINGGGMRNVTATDTVIANSNLSQNGYTGVLVQTARNVTITNTSVTGTQGTPPALVQGSPPFPSSGILVRNSTGLTLTDIDARAQAEWAYYAVPNSTSTVKNLSTDAGDISFEARDIGLTPTATAPVNASAANVTTINDDWLVLNTSTNAFIGLLDQQETTTTMDDADNETTTTAKVVRPVA